VRDIVNHPAFSGFGELLLPRDNNSSYYNTGLSNIASLIPYHQNVNPADVVNALNTMIDQANSGEKIFYDFYTMAQKRADPAKENTGLFFFRGNQGTKGSRAPFAIICPGGGFSYVGSLHEGFPIAHALSKRGYNAFVIRYRIGGERIACEDLAAAIVELRDGSPAQAVEACAIALKNQLGLVCDPVATLVEDPCVKRNAGGVMCAIAAAAMALAGIKSMIPVDEVIPALSLPVRIACLPGTPNQPGIHIVWLFLPAPLLFWLGHFHPSVTRYSPGQSAVPDGYPFSLCPEAASSPSPRA
jgi:hypothetical protein